MFATSTKRPSVMHLTAFVFWVTSTVGSNAALASEVEIRLFSDSCPSRTVELAGQIVNAVDYPDLAEAFGDTGSTTVVLPSLDPPHFANARSVLSAHDELPRFKYCAALSTDKVTLDMDDCSENPVASSTATQGQNPTPYLSFAPALRQGAMYADEGKPFTAQIALGEGCISCECAIDSVLVGPQMADANGGAVKLFGFPTLENLDETTLEINRGKLDQMRVGYVNYLVLSLGYDISSDIVTFFSGDRMTPERFRALFVEMFGESNFEDIESGRVTIKTGKVSENDPANTAARFRFDNRSPQFDDNGTKYSPKFLDFNYKVVVDCGGTQRELDPPLRGSGGNNFN